MLLELRLELRLRNRADHLIDELSVLEEKNRRDRANLEASRRADVRVYIELRDLRLACVLDSKLVENRRNHAAGATPRRPEINDRQSWMLLDFILEIIVCYFNCIRHLQPSLAGFPDRLTELSFGSLSTSNLMQNKAPKGTRIAHVGIALPSIQAQLPFFRDILGMNQVEIANSDGARIEALEAGESLVELLEPAGEDTPIGKFIARRGAGIHHICFAVDDLEATLEKCRAAGVRLIDEIPRIGAEGRMIAFIHPSSTGGILVELTGPLS